MTKKKTKRKPKGQPTGAFEQFLAARTFFGKWAIQAEFGTGSGGEVDAYEVQRERYLISRLSQDNDWLYLGTTFAFVRLPFPCPKKVPNGYASLPENHYFNWPPIPSALPAHHPLHDLFWFYDEEDWNWTDYHRHPDDQLDRYMPFSLNHIQYYFESRDEHWIRFRFPYADLGLIGQGIFRKRKRSPRKSFDPSEGRFPFSLLSLDVYHSV